MCTVLDRHCKFDGGDCCYDDDEDTICWFTYNPLKKNETVIKEVFLQNWDICNTTDLNNYTCSLKATVFYGGRSRNLYAYKMVEFADGKQSLLKSQGPFYNLPGLHDFPYVGLTYVPNRGKIYFVGK